MTKSKTQLSVIDNTGARRSPQIMIGESNTYTSGDILDANATKELIDASGGIEDIYMNGDVITIDGITSIESDCTVHGDITIDGNIIYTNVDIIHINESVGDSQKVQIYGDLGKDNNLVLAWIRKNTKIVITEYNEYLGVLECIDYDGEGEDYDCFVKLPQFWYKCVTTAHGCDLMFTYDYTNVDGSWNEWDGNTFIGCYKAILTFGSNIKKSDLSTIEPQMYSRSEKYPQTNFSYDQGRAFSRARGEGFSMVTYDSHKIMEILFYAWYGDVDAQAICGTGSAVNKWDSANIVNGRHMADGISMTDTKASDNPENTVFWGLMDWWGNVYEWIDDVKILSSRLVGNDRYNDVAILNYDGSIKRIIHKYRDVGGYTHKKLWGRYADVFPTGDNADDETVGYTVYGGVYGGPGDVAIRSGYSDGSSGGVGYLWIYDDPDYAVPDYGSRLQYHGPWVEVSEFSSNS